MKIKKIIYISEYRNGKPIRTKCIKGIVQESSDHFLKLRTSHRELEIGKEFILSIEDTGEEFREAIK